MKKAFIAVFVITISAVCLNAQDLKLEQIIKKHLEMAGQDKLNSVQSIKITGKLLVQGMEMPFTIVKKRPAKYRFDAVFQGASMVQAYNGTTGFSINPMTGSTEPQDATEDQINNFKEQANFDNEFYKYAEIGTKLELIGKEDVNGKMAYHLKSTKKPLKEGDAGKTTDVFLDAESFQIVKTISKVNMNNNEMEVEAYLTNYKTIDGIAFPGVMEQKAMGNTMVTLNFDEIKLNEAVEDSYFEKPKK